MTLTPRQKQLRGKTVKTLHGRQYKRAICRVQLGGGGKNKKKNRIIEEKSKSEHNNPTREQEKERK